MRSYNLVNDLRPITTTALKERKQKGEKIPCLTAYDATFAHVADQCGVEMLLVGDSLGMVLKGYDSTVPVSVDDMVYHTECVAAGREKALIFSDMPFMSFSTIEDTFKNSARLMQAGAHMVKIEGDRWLEESIFQLSQRGIPTCVHLGLTPQTVNKLGGYKVQGRGEQAAAMIETAKCMEEAGADSLLLECVPSKLAADITAAVGIPVIGIGAGADCDGQILVMHDMLGVTIGKQPRFVRDFMQSTGSIQGAISAYVKAVKEVSFPSAENTFSETAPAKK